MKKGKKLSVFQLILIVGDFLLLAVLSVNGWRLFQMYLKSKSALTSNLLTNHPEEFIENITANGVPLWAWFVEIGALVITVGLLVAWVFPKLRDRLHLTLTNGVWLILWIGYFLFLVILGMVVLNSLMSFT